MIPASPLSPAVFAGTPQPEGSIALVTLRPGRGATEERTEWTAVPEFRVPIAQDLPVRPPLPRAPHRHFRTFAAGRQSRELLRFYRDWLTPRQCYGRLRRVTR